ncbi:MAG: TraR/DksA C4-type zinc finger protein [Methylotetracoccus sp.]
MDIVDQAEGLIELQRDAALRRFRDSTSFCEAQLKEAVGADGSARVLCRDCLDPIQPERLRAAPRAVRCIECQRDYEAGEMADARAGSAG